MAAFADVQRRFVSLGATVLGPEYRYRSCAASLVLRAPEITTAARLPDSDFAVDASALWGHLSSCPSPTWISIGGTQFQGAGRERRSTAGSIQRHPEIDVAVMRVNGPHLPLARCRVPGGVGSSVVVQHRVHDAATPNFPAITDAAVSMQHGAVPSESVTSVERVPRFRSLTRVPPPPRR